jgi:hypothetical protein
LPHEKCYRKETMPQIENVTQITIEMPVLPHQKSNPNQGRLSGSTVPEDQNGINHAKRNKQLLCRSIPVAKKPNGKRSRPFWTNSTS